MYSNITKRFAKVSITQNEKLRSHVVKRADLNRRGVKSFPTPSRPADLRAHTLMVDLLQRLNLTSKVRLNYERASAVYRNLFLGQKLCPPATKPYKFAGN